MERWQFTDDLISGIDEINSQHRELLARGNAILFPETGKLREREILKTP